MEGTVSAPSYGIPPPQNFAVQAEWIPKGKSVNIAGFCIDCGMLYVGGKLRAANGSQDPAAIDPAKLVDSKATPHVRHTQYWPSYSTATPQARGAFLKWLATGRDDPHADIGYVFMYFNGLERRVLLDLQDADKRRAEIPLIQAELQRLLAIYGPLNHSFNGYCGRLLEWVELADFDSKLYAKPVPTLQPCYELPWYLRVALGQAARDGVPIPPHLALACALYHPLISKRTPVQRCPEQFERLFEVQYRELYGQGIKLSANKTRLKLPYHPASAGFQGLRDVNLSFPDIPDITVQTAYLPKLQQVVDLCTKELESYSRFIGRNPSKAQSLEGLLQLPVSLWPATSREALVQLKQRVGDGMLVLTLQDLVAAFGSAGDLNKERLQAFARALEAEHIGIEPDVLGGARAIKAEDHVVLFHSEFLAGSARSTTAYHAALVTLELASVVAHADGDFSATELQHLNTHIDTWVHLSPAHQARLKARTRLLMLVPVTMASMKKKVEGLSLQAREAIGQFAAMMVSVDGRVSPEEMKLLEKIYILLGIDSKLAHSAVHATAMGGAVALPVASPAATATTPSKSQTVGFVLDAAKIAALQADSAKVSALLADIFTEDAPVEMAAIASDDTDASDVALISQTIIGLDEQHSAFARLLLSRASWERSELVDVAQDMNIMLDGALERVNEASFDAFDMALAEGDDPIEITPDIVEKLST
jgi:tellurite resistance protein